MKYLAIVPLFLTGCMSSQNTNTIDELINPEPTIHIPHNVASQKDWDGSKGKFPPGRTINYKGHGVEYTTGNGHISKHTHHYHTHE